MEPVQVREQPLGEGFGGVESPAQLLLAALQFLHGHVPWMEVCAPVGPGVLRRFLAARCALDEPAFRLQPLVQGCLWHGHECAEHGNRDAGPLEKVELLIENRGVIIVKAHDHAGGNE